MFTRRKMCRFMYFLFSYQLSNLESNRKYLTSSIDIVATFNFKIKSSYTTKIVSLGVVDNDCSYTSGRCFCPRTIYNTHLDDECVCPFKSTLHEYDYCKNQFPPSKCV